MLLRTRAVQVRMLERAEARAIRRDVAEAQAGGDGALRCEGMQHGRSPDVERRCGEVPAPPAKRQAACLASYRAPQGKPRNGTPEPPSRCRFAAERTPGGGNSCAPVAVAVRPSVRGMAVALQA